MEPSLILPAFTRAELVHSRAALLRHFELFCAYEEIDPQQAERTSVGYFVRRNSSKGQWPVEGVAQYRYLVNEVRLDEFGNRALVSQAIGEARAGAFVGLCSYLDLPLATEYLRSAYLGPVMWERYGSSSLAIHSSAATGALNLSQKEPNATFSGSCYCETRYGDLLRIGAQDAVRTLEFFQVARLPEVSEPAQVALGAQCYLAYALSTDAKEPLRLAICRQWNVDLAIKDLKRWQRSLKARGACKAE
jgi:hypothetical protein